MHTKYLNSQIEDKITNFTEINRPENKENQQKRDFIV